MCNNTGVGIHNCGHHEDAGVICSDGANMHSLHICSLCVDVC